jgi:antitoxin component YwqK of YwqJK toxin-antitoxin module
MSSKFLVNLANTLTQQQKNKTNYPRRIMSEQLEINDKDVDDVLDFRGCDNAGGPIYYYNNLPFTGVIRSYYDDGKIQDDVEYLDGHIGGLCRKFYANGQIKEECFQYFGRLDKHFKMWDENGNLIRYSLYDDGEKIKQLIPESE